MRKGAKALVFASAVMAVILAAMLVSIMESKAYAASTTSNASVTVTIGAVTIVDVTPQTMDFGIAYPGSIDYNYTDGGVTLTQIQIENLGSTNITRVWFNVTQPATNPFGTGDPTAYDPANFLTLKRTTDTTYYFIDRKEWNSTYQIIYLKLPSNWKTYGKIRDANHEYFWTINGSLTACNETGNTLVIGLTPHNETQTGTIDLDTGNVWIGTINAGNVGDDWGIVDAANVGGAQYCIAVYKDCSLLRVYKWNPDAPEAATCTTDSDFNTGIMYPGDSIIADVALHVPYGVPQGTLSTGTLTVLASTV